jgi:hypothetical protein
MKVIFANPNLTEFIVSEVVGNEVRLRQHNFVTVKREYEEGMIIKDISQSRMDSIEQSLPYLINMKGLHINSILA